MVNEVNGVEGMQIIPNEPLIAQLYLQCKEKGEAIAVYDHATKQTITRWQLLSDVLTLSAYIHQQLPDRVRTSLADRDADADIFICMMMGSQYEELVAYLALYVLGATLVLLSPGVLPAEAEYFMSLSGAVALVVSPSRTEIFNQVQTNSSVTRIPLSSVMTPKLDLSSEKSRLDDKPPMNPEKGLVLLLTSGTTGSPKGILHSRKSILASARNLPSMWSFSSEEVALMPHSLAWIAGVCFCSGLLFGGASVELCETVLSPNFFWDRISAGPVAVFSSTPPFFSKLRAYIEARLKQETPERKERFLNGIRASRVLNTGSGYLADDLSRYWTKLRGGRPLVSSYGSTELGVPFCVTHHKAIEIPPFCVGETASNVEINLQDGEEGELRVKTETVFKRYIKLTPGPQGEGFDENGFYVTGDMFRREGNNLFALGRASHDVIRFNDWMVYSPAIENVLLSVPGVETAVVLGIADDQDGQEQIAALISLTKSVNEQMSKMREESGTTFSQSLHRYILTEKKLPLYWSPTVVRVVGPEDEIPRNVRGKVDKKRVREKFFNVSLPDMEQNSAFEVTTLADLSKYDTDAPFQRWAWAEH